MKHIWAPWRIEYIKSQKETGCFLCRYFGESKDQENLVLARGKSMGIVINRYPYTGGHLMICPYRHISSMAEMTDAEMLESMKWTAMCVEILKRHMRPEGFNIGLNLGEAGGAGLKDHLHIHVVPRWIGDTNFATVTGDFRVIPQALEAIWVELKPSFDAAQKSCK